MTLHQDLHYYLFFEIDVPLSEICNGSFFIILILQYVGFGHGMNCTSALLVTRGLVIFGSTANAQCTYDFLVPTEGKRKEYGL
jgi:hypothetical protein